MSSDDKKPAGAVPPGKRAKRTALARSGELWAKCPECRMPVKDAKLFTHLLKCPGADVRQAEWKAQEAKAKLEPKPDLEAQPQ